jgi:hypothetical protein
VKLELGEECSWGYEIEYSRKHEIECTSEDGSPRGSWESNAPESMKSSSLGTENGA